MGWETRRGRTYYYRKWRDDGGRVRSTYLGREMTGHLVAELDALGQALPAYRAGALDRFGAFLDASDAATRAYTGFVGEMLAAEMEREGFRYHRGEWRRPRRRPGSEGKAQASTAGETPSGP